MSTAALSAAAIPLMGIAADVAMGMFFAPATRVGVVDKAPRERLPDAVRDSIRRGQGGRCAKCGKRFYAGNMEIDHRWPIAKGGQNWMVNLQALCRSCNRSKGAKLEPVVLDILSGALAVSADFVHAGKNWVSKLEFGKLVDLNNLTGQASALLPFIVISPTTAILIIGGVVLVVAGFFAVKWLLGHADGERRYVRMARTMRDSLSTLAHHTGRLTRHLESAARARQAQAQIARSARFAGNAAGAVAGQVGRASDHVPRLAGNAGRAATDQVRALPGRVPSVSVPLDPMSRHASDVSRRAGEVSRQAGHMPARVSRQARNVVAGATPVRERAQDTLGRMAGRVPRFPRRQQQATGVAEAG